jgi:hypothetical protein
VEGHSRTTYCTCGHVWAVTSVPGAVTAAVFHPPTIAMIAFSRAKDLVQKEQ